MKPAKAQQLQKESLPEAPTWLKEMQKDVQESRLGRMSEEEVGQLCAELAERGARKRQPQKASK